MFNLLILSVLATVQFGFLRNVRKIIVLMKVNYMTKTLELFSVKIGSGSLTAHLPVVPDPHNYTNYS